MGLGPVLVGIDGTALTGEARDILRHPLTGGVVLFRRNFVDRDQIIALADEIRLLRSPRLLLAVDQEGGRVQRFHSGFTRLPPLGAIGALYDSDPGEARAYARWHGRLMATEMLSVGIDLSFAPVLDLDRGSDVIGDRAFAADPAVVIDLGGAYLEGMHMAGMKTTGKHFPGHGSVQADSHIDDVCDPRDLEAISGSDLKPFESLAEGLDAMMIAHVVYPCLDDRPAGYSPSWLKKQLRQRIGFSGVIFSDDLGMHAAKVQGGLVDRTQACLDAGCDAALVCRPQDAATLLAQWGERPVQDATRPLGGLYGTPAPDTSSGELTAWRGRLERLQSVA